VRTLADVERELNAMGRPRVNPLAPWKSGGAMPELDAWRAANPDGDVRYAALLAELDALEVEARRRREFDASAESLGVGLRLVRALSSLRDTEAVRLARAWWEGSRTWLVMLGHTGVGKSVAAAAVAREAKGAVWCPATSLTQATFDGDGARLAKAPLLVVDDFGTEHRSAFAASCWHQVLADRHENERRTVLTANLTRAELRSVLGDRLADRVASDCELHELHGDSLRRGR